jgi:hypothetical protein
MKATAYHEASHAIAARRARLGVIRVVAHSDDPHCRTRWRRPQTPEQQVDVLERLALVDLVGDIVETPDSPHAAIDRESAMRRCREIIAIKAGVPVEQLDDARHAEATKIYAWLASEAAWVVDDSRVAIARLAAILEERGEVDGRVVEAVLLEVQS